MEDEQEFFREIQEQVIFAIDELCEKYGIDSDTVMYEFFLGVIKNPEEINSISAFKAVNDEEMEFMFQEVSRSFAEKIQEENNITWNGFGLN